MNVNEQINKLIELALAEDIGEGDHTTLCSIPSDAEGRAHLVIKEQGILAGVDVAKTLLNRFDKNITLEVNIMTGKK